MSLRGRLHALPDADLALAALFLANGARARTRDADQAVAVERAQIAVGLAVPEEMRRRGLDPAQVAADILEPLIFAEVAALMERPEEGE